MAKSKIDKTLKKIVDATSMTNSLTTLNTNSLGDPDCPYCQGIGYVRSDLPVGHENFGKLEVCVCRRKDIVSGVREKLYELSHLDQLSHLTFETFNPRGKKDTREVHANSTEAAYNRSRQYAEKLDKWLLLQGEFGTGKTHLAAAIANYAVSMGVPTLFLTVPDLLDTLRFSYDSEGTTFEERFNDIRNSKLLILDDFGTQNATDWAQEKLFQIINYRYINHLPLVITTNLSLEQIEPRISSRLKDRNLVEWVPIDAPDYRHPHDITHPSLSSLHFLSNYTFQNFSLRKNDGLKTEETQSLETAYKAAVEYAKNPDGWIVFIGSFGCGKTHLAAAIGNYRIQHDKPTPLFVVVPDLLDHLRSTFNPNSTVSYDSRFEEVRDAPLLILDDLGAPSMTPWVKEKLYQLINYRYNAQRATVITSADKLTEMDPRIRSRLLDEGLCSIYAITAPSYHGGRAKKIKK